MEEYSEKMQEYSKKMSRYKSEFDDYNSDYTKLYGNLDGEDISEKIADLKSQIESAEYELEKLEVNSEESKLSAEQTLNNAVLGASTAGEIYAHAVEQINSGIAEKQENYDKLKKEYMRSDEIKKMIDIGEPLKGVTYEEYRDFCIKYKHSDVTGNGRQGYTQALKGDNAALKNKEWRTNPEYRVPQRLFSSPEVTADREAALEKLRRGEEITEWENLLLRTFPNMKRHIKTRSTDLVPRVRVYAVFVF